MPSFSAQQLERLTAGTWLGGRLPAGAVSGFTQDSRLLQPGMCFIALQTAQRDGHAFLAAALAAGAAMALVARGDASCPLPQLVVPDPLAAFQQIARAHRLGFSGKVIGVTGSCGKTSTKNILQTLLGEGCHATVGNLNNFIGVPLTLLALETGADAVADESSSGSAVAEANGKPLPQFAVVEAGISEPGEMATLADMIRPDIALITMVGAAHLQDLGSVEGVAAEKSVLAHAHREDSGNQRLPLLFAPLECWSYPAFTALHNAGVAVAAFEQEHADDDALVLALPPAIALHRYKLGRLDKAVDGVEAYLSIEGERLTARFPLSIVPSLGMTSNLALALIAAHTLGVGVEQLTERVRNWRPQGNRGSWKRGGGKHFFVDCYNANPSSMADSLSHFNAATAVAGDAARNEPRLYVIGGMRELGAESALWHKRLGLQLGVLLGCSRRDAVITIGTGEDNAALAEGVRLHAPQVTVHSFTQTQEARALVDAFCGTVFLKGSRFYALESLLPEAVEET